VYPTSFANKKKKKNPVEKTIIFFVAVTPNCTFGNSGFSGNLHYCHATGKHSKSALSNSL